MGVSSSLFSLPRISGRRIGEPAGAAKASRHRPRAWKRRGRPPVLRGAEYWSKARRFSSAFLLPSHVLLVRSTPPRGTGRRLARRLATDLAGPCGEADLLS